MSILLADLLRFGSAHAEGIRSLSDSTAAGTAWHRRTAQIAPLSCSLRRLRISVVPMAAVLGIATSLSPAALAQQQSVGTIVYMHAPDGSPPWPVTDIYSINTDGSNVKALTRDGHSHNPSWSPDGRRILFIHDSTLSAKPPYREQNGFESYHPIELYVMDADGGNRHLIRRLEPVIFSAAWSPDGKTLAITCIPEARANRPQPTDEPMPAGLFLLRSDGRGKLRLLFPNAFTPSWSPDGKKLAFSVDQPRGQWAVHVANSDGSGDVQLTSPSRMGGSPAWAPDGKLIAFSEFVDQGRRQQIFVMDANGSHVRQITTDSRWSCGAPSWSPDGEQIAFSCRSASTPCGGVSSIGSILPECDRRIFIASLRDSKSKPRQLNEHDGASAVFAPIP
jgi:Tol biopolymer transport system component